MEKIIVFYHIFLCEDVSKIVREQVSKIKKTDLYRNAEIRIFINDVYDGQYKIDDDVMDSMKQIATSIKIYSENWFEIYTHIQMYNTSLVEDGYFLYMHTKGVTRINHKDEYHSQGLYSYKNVENWRHIMEHFCIENWRHCVDKIKNYDLVGCNYIPQFSLWTPPHYSGGFWWANSNFLKRLPDPKSYITNEIDRFQAEFWIGRIPHKALCLYPIPKPVPEKHNRCFVYTPTEDYENNIIEQEFQSI
jgi:hypothetical protein